MTLTAKICGINDPRAMRAALEGGASHVGLVFYPKSPRFVSLDQAANLSSMAAKKAARVALFVDPSDADLHAVLSAVPIELVQLHGSESPERTAEIKITTGRPVMKVISVSDSTDIARAKDYFDVADWLMFDAKPPNSLKNALPGGNAVSFDWSLLSAKTWPLPWMLAGGLTAENVAEAIRLTGAKVVDTSSGVEDTPGKKNPAKIKAFLEAVAQSA
ncbi:MAG: phosphoribosylanthranilate isomerase [Proteobacteria bacterium]|nr:phosphoribosylanthranilate isomerase [Pseudomonadota bacterium]